MIRILTLGLQFAMLNAGQSKPAKNILKEGMDVITTLGSALKDKKIQQKPSRTLIIVKDLKHAEILHSNIPNSFKLEGKDDLGIRKKTIDAFKDDKISVLIGTTIMQTGIDIPEITHLINARGLKSEIATLQALGRALRIHKSKNRVFIYDFFDRAPYLEKHAKERIKSYKSLGLEIKNEK